MEKSASQSKRLSPEARKKQLLDVARDLLAEQRHLPLSFEAIAAAANVSPPLVYNYFPDAATLYNLIIQEELRTLDGALSLTSETIEEAASTYLDFLIEHGTALSTIMTDPSMKGKLAATPLKARNGLLKRFANVIHGETGCTIREAILTVLSFSAIPEEFAIQVRQGVLKATDAQAYVGQLARLSLRTLRKQGRTA
ncbi:MAG: TetR/AcrR family transcriptional regulator [Alphaproteobacteria bacterium]